ncbi:hypothetical protein [Variovorax saccharolyticus]|uniref:hypothetical protein n=1 Tax=Variovorax saccharolyticus TaxID=3053516 RepID=UPI0025786C67|nr:hypothetical protein [Variovorax sp. J31P216]MDM0023338.1 hypothetical protein [Variovorax sp. J31P216]
MNAKQLLGVSALALAGATAFAQTVPAELWVGAPIATTASAASRSAVAADYSASRTMASAPQELRVGPADTAPGAMSRAEVAADTNLWIKSGMSQLANRDSFDPTSPAYRAQFAAYERMRNGPAFVAEVQRLKGSTIKQTTTAQVDAGTPAE